VVTEPATLSGASHVVRMMLAVRAQHGWSQLELAQRLSISRRTINRWENGHAEPPVYLLAALRELLSDTQKPGM
jgi:transcriptional regulator with XRE-family HTH domain